MSKEAVFTLKLEPELRDAFMAEAEAADRPASQIVREMMRDYIDQRREAREYDAFLRHKVEIARASVKADRVRPNSEVDVEFARKRRIEAMRLQEIEGNPLDPEQVAMFEMFEAEAWPHDRRRAYILAKASALATK